MVVLDLYCNHYLNNNEYLVDFVLSRITEKNKSILRKSIPEILDGNE